MVEFYLFHSVHSSCGFLQCFPPDHNLEKVRVVRSHHDFSIGIPHERPELIACTGFSRSIHHRCCNFPREYQNVLHERVQLPQVLAATLAGNYVQLVLRKGARERGYPADTKISLRTFFSSFDSGAWEAQKWLYGPYL